VSPDPSGNLRPDASGPPRNISYTLVLTYIRCDRIIIALAKIRQLCENTKYFPNLIVDDDQEVSNSAGSQYLSQL
jgi:hypothetical protein